MERQENRQEPATRARFWRWFSVALVSACFWGGCGLYDGLTGTPVGADAGGVPNGSDASGSEIEDCDGREGEPCGVCGDGWRECVDGHQLICREATVPNECGGCPPLHAPVGAACGACFDGTWKCDDQGELVCDGATDQTNACGGCSELEGTPLWECSNEHGLEGIWRCSGPDSVQCTLPSENPCGGSTTLENLPGESCGICGGGVWACRSATAVECEEPNRGANACGGCDRLYGVVGQPCGACGGVWACAGDNQVLCDESDSQECEAG